MKKSVLLFILGVLVSGSTVFGGTYSIDSAHSDIGFSVRHLGVSKTRGQFSDVSGTVIWKGIKNLKAASLEGIVQIKSINTHNKKRDTHLKSDDFFDAIQYPTMTFVSQKIYKKRGSLYAKGQLTIHGVTKEVTFPIEVSGPVKDPWGNIKIGVEGELTINRRDYGLTWSKTLDQGGLVVGNKIKISVSIEGTKQK